MKSIIKTTAVPTLYARVIAGFIFVSEGIQKFLFPGELGTGRFAKIGLGNPGFWAPFTGLFEISCGLLLVTGLLTRLAALPLLFIMAVAFITTKIPLWAAKGFWAFAHEYRTDFVLTLLLVFLLVYGGGNYSLDKK
jgi:uncharacterized membrane protein YphA (DoxX/SURF4 family)